MGSVVTAPVNEAVNFLSRVAPGELARLRAALPEIAEDLRPGVMAGAEELDEDTNRAILFAKAKAMLVALREAKRMCEDAIPEASGRLQRGGTARFCCQVVTAVASASVLGALGFSAGWVAAISGFLALVGSIGSLFADQIERVIDPKQGNLSTIYLQLVDSRYKAGALQAALQIQIDYRNAGQALEKAITDGNALCEQVHTSFYQILPARSARAQVEPEDDATALPSRAG